MKLPAISGHDAIKTLKKAGFVAIRQKGSHVRLERIDGITVTKITVPLHKTLKKGTLERIIKDAGLTTDEFLQLL
jgi:predicted RNA binding protein YcfA (HicA-like mRNA interferase family)